ncbi:hypothetical protein F8388_026412 [Cannabis sativa]|uniref:Uncharacterized protein n=1 Tax=Cannabis sativa TaxID=3483 RepID=A0A7J6ETG3_CANSA|nr:hypothetical protein F8388_026412 [Cannabis sativa]
MEVRAWCTADLLKVVSSKRMFSWWSEEAEMDGGKEVGCGRRNGCGDCGDVRSSVTGVVRSSGDDDVNGE